jgi:hypothetical protein
MNTLILHNDPALKLMIEYVYEEETGRQNWDSSFIESVYNSYITKGGLTDKQKEIVEKRYKNMSEGGSYGR